jgi:protein-tyrosine sulfotransferase
MRNKLSYYKTFLNRSCPLRRDEGFEPTFIIGSGRSGNTLLRRILFNDPSIYIPPETYVLGKSIDKFSRFAKTDWDNLVRITLSEFSLSRDFHFFPTQNLRPLYLALLDVSPDERSYAVIVDKFYMFMATQIKSGATRWGDKTPLNVFALSKIDAVFPGAKYIHLVRDGYDVTASYMKMQGAGDAKGAAERWRLANDLCEVFIRAKGAEAVMQVKYEDIVLTPDMVVPSICTFLGMVYSDSLLKAPSHPEQLGDMTMSHYKGVDKAISQGSIGKGRNSLNETQINLIEPIVEPMNQKYGYEKRDTT